MADSHPVSQSVSLPPWDVSTTRIIRYHGGECGGKSWKSRMRKHTPLTTLTEAVSTFSFFPQPLSHSQSVTHSQSVSGRSLAHTLDTLLRANNCTVPGRPHATAHSLTVVHSLTVARSLTRPLTRHTNHSIPGEQRLVTTPVLSVRRTEA